MISERLKNGFTTRERDKPKGIEQAVKRKRDDETEVSQGIIKAIKPLFKVILAGIVGEPNQNGELSHETTLLQHSQGTTHELCQHRRKHQQ